MKHLAAILFLFCWPILVMAQTSFTASADATQVVYGNYFTVKFELLNAQGKLFQPPTFSKDFVTLNGPNHYMQSQFTGRGGAKIVMGYTYDLQPKRIGKFTIPPASIKVGNQIYKTKPLVIEVLKGKGNIKKRTPGKGGDKEIEENVNITMSLSDTTVYPGQQIIVEYKILTKMNVQLADGFVSEPTFPGFHVSYFRYDNSNKKEVINGEQYVTRVLKKVALFPLQSGLAPISPFEKFIAAGQRRATLSSDSMTIKVLKFPQPMPPSFSGAIGKFNVQTKVDRRVLTTSESILFTMTVSGDSDIKQVLPPKLELDEEMFEIFDVRTVHEKIDVVNARVVGLKVFEYVIVPKKEGNYPMKPRFSYLDSDSLSYMEVNLPVYNLRISPGIGSVNRAEELRKQQEAAAMKGIMDSTTVSKGRNQFLGSIFFWLGSILPFFLLGGLVVYKKRKDEEAAELLREQKINNSTRKAAEMRLADARSHLSHKQPKPAQQAVKKALQLFAIQTLEVPISQVDAVGISDRLRSLSIDQKLVQDFIDLLQQPEEQAELSNTKVACQEAEDVIARIAYDLEQNKIAANEQIR